MIARILAYWPPTDRYWPCHGDMDGGHLHMAGGKWELDLLHEMIVRAHRPAGAGCLAKPILAGFDILDSETLGCDTLNTNRWTLAYPRMSRRARCLR